MDSAAQKSDGDAKAEERRLRNNLFSLESDLDTNERKRQTLSTEVRQMSKKRDELEAMLKEREGDMIKLEKDAVFLEEEIARLKNRIKNIHFDTQS